MTQLDPQHGLAWLRLGQLYQQARRSQEANQAYKRAAALLSTGSVESRQAQQQLAVLQPGLPIAMATGWSEFMRQMIGPILICILAACLTPVCAPGGFTGPAGWHFVIAIMGTFLWVSGDSLPRNPLICLLLGERRFDIHPAPLADFHIRPVLLVCGLWPDCAADWRQSFPESPNI